MASINVHTGIFTSPKFVPLSDGAFRLWAHALMWSKEHLTDGYIPAGMLPALHRNAAKLVPELLRVLVPGKGPLWHAETDGYRIHDFADWQDTATTVQVRRRKWREIKRGIKPTSMQDSTVESTPESTMESRSGVVVGGVVGIEITDQQTLTASAKPPASADGGSEWGASPVRRLSPRNAYQARRKGLSVPDFLHEELLSRLAVSDEPALLAWYAETERAYDGQAIGETNLQFWRARFAEWQGTTPKARVSVVQPLEDFIPARFKTGGVA